MPDSPDKTLTNDLFPTPKDEDPSDLAIHLFNHLNSEYADSWANDARYWQDQGLYAVAAEMIGLQPGGSHVDVGSGTGDLLAVLRKKTEDSLIYGVDVNEYLLMAAFERMDKLGIHANIAGSKVLTISENGKKVSYKPVFHKQMEGLDLASRAKIQLICDDIRSREIIDRILGKRKIDSGSLLMPGCSISQCLQEPYEIGDVEKEELGRRSETIADKVRKSTFEFMAQRLKEGGRLVMGERLMVAEGHEEDMVNHSIQREIEPYLDYFDSSLMFSMINHDLIDGVNIKTGDPEGSTIINPSSTITLLSHDSKTRVENAYGRKAKMIALVYRLIRNGNPYKTDNGESDAKRRKRNHRKKQRKSGK